MVNIRIAFIFAIVAFGGIVVDVASQQLQKFDVAIVVDNTKLPDDDREQSLRVRRTTDYNVKCQHRVILYWIFKAIRANLSEVDTRVGVFLHNGNENKMVEPFSTRYLNDANAISEALTKAAGSRRDGYKLSQFDSKVQEVKRMIESEPSNRPDDMDLIIWYFGGVKEGLRIRDEIRIAGARVSSNEPKRIHLFVLTRFLSDCRSATIYRPKVVKDGNTLVAGGTYEVTETNFDRYFLESLEPIIAACYDNSSAANVQCHFADDQGAKSCVMNKKTIPELCATPVMEKFECNKPEGECQRLCDADQQDFTPCNADCELPGHKKTRPRKKIAADPFYVNCPDVEEPCHGPDCTCPSDVQYKEIESSCAPSETGKCVKQITFEASTDMEHRFRRHCDRAPEIRDCDQEICNNECDRDTQWYGECQGECGGHRGYKEQRSMRAHNGDKAFAHCPTKNFTQCKTAPCSTTDADTTKIIPTTTPRAAVGSDTTSAPILEIGHWILIGLGGLALLAIVIIIIVVVCRKKAKKRVGSGAKGGKDGGGRWGRWRRGPGQGQGGAGGRRGPSPPRRAPESRGGSRNRSMTRGSVATTATSTMATTGYSRTEGNQSTTISKSRAPPPPRSPRRQSPSPRRHARR